ncbi:unnamed protein product [Owenia fusiformis]|uniref:Uncharacterized protein n=1 Tax=Owenia fusiformis TaxID=6347 RepID=A0A8J1XNL5_OWEFU|nr:unnamed protein product [Owenia fusiformis]
MTPILLCMGLVLQIGIQLTKGQTGTNGQWCCEIELRPIVRTIRLTMTEIAYRNTTKRILDRYVPCNDTDGGDTGRGQGQPDRGYGGGGQGQPDRGYGGRGQEGRGQVQPDGGYGGRGQRQPDRGQEGRGQGGYIDRGHGGTGQGSRDPYRGRTEDWYRGRTTPSYIPDIRPTQPQNRCRWNRCNRRNNRNGRNNRRRNQGGQRRRTNTGSFDHDTASREWVERHFMGSTIDPMTVNLEKLRPLYERHHWSQVRPNQRRSSLGGDRRAKRQAASQTGTTYRRRTVSNYCPIYKTITQSHPYTRIGYTTREDVRYPSCPNQYLKCCPGYVLIGNGCIEERRAAAVNETYQRSMDNPLFKILGGA